MHIYDQPFSINTYCDIWSELQAKENILQECRSHSFEAMTGSEPSCFWEPKRNHSATTLLYLLFKIDLTYSRSNHEKENPQGNPIWSAFQMHLAAHKPIQNVAVK